ncbi:MAG: hypothetical protein KDI31_19170, partial [Pseudomonadales bacterium]|nr:hypothetical protein [Pseudomonadales bacterium]
MTRSAGFDQGSRLIGLLIGAGMLWLASFPAAARELPDFTELVEKNAPAEVNISSIRHAPSADQSRPRSRNEELEEFFRRFFPPGQGGPQPYSRPQSLGSGFVLEDGYIVTNNHV